jgi:hypothetical protein
MIVSAMLMLTSCSENYSNGERIGVITKFSKTGILWKSYEGHLNVTQTGMNSSIPFDFSIDNDTELDNSLIAAIDSSAQFGWKVKLIYHQVRGYNWFRNRGNTNYFIEKCEILDRQFGNNFNIANEQQNTTGRIIDTIYVVIDRSK